MDDKKKKFIKPEAEITEFAGEDVILTSNPFKADGGTNNGEWW